MKKIKSNTLLMDLIYDIIGATLYSTAIYIFAKNANFAPGGISGVSLIIHHLWGLPVGIVSLIINIPLILLSYRFVGKKFLIKTLRSMIFCTVFVDVIFPHLPAYTGEPLLAAVFSGVFLGAGLAFFYMRGSSSGGTDFLILPIKIMRPHLSVGVVTMVLDLIIIMLGWPVFGSIDSVLYGLVTTAVNSIVIDKIMYGVGAGKLILIISSKGQQVADYIARECDRGSTMSQAVGTYTGEERQILFCACSKSEAYKIRSAAYQIDERSFVMIAEASEVYGEGFIHPGKKASFL